MIFTWSPIKAKNLPSKRKHIDTILDDPRLAKYRNMKGYNDHVRNTMVNYCSSTSMDISLRYIYPKVLDHNYLEKSFAENWIDNALTVSFYSILFGAQIVIVTVSRLNPSGYMRMRGSQL
jgi:hypothetical protein